MEALFLIVFVYFILNAIYLFIAGCIYSVFGDDLGDVILAAPLIIGLFLIIMLLIG